MPGARYATLLLNESAELTLTSGDAPPQRFAASPGVVSFEVPRKAGLQHLLVPRPPPTFLLVAYRSPIGVLYHFLLR